MRFELTQACTSVRLVGASLQPLGYPPNLKHINPYLASLGFKPKFLGDDFIAIKRVETTNFPLVKFFVVVHCQSSEQTQLME